MSIGNLVRIYGQDFDFSPRVAPPCLSYCIATTARTGSTLLAMDLWRSGLGAPFEYLNRPYMGELIARLGAGTLEAYWSNLSRVRTDSRGIFGAKVFYPHFSLWDAPSEEVAARVAPTHTIFLTRNDKIAQAVSLSRAVQTQAWAKGALEQVPPTYDFEHIRVRLAAMADQEANWLRLLAAQGMPPLHISFEDFLADREGTCRKIAAHLGHETRPIHHREAPAVESQGDDLNIEWSDRFRHDLAHPAARDSK